MKSSRATELYKNTLFADYTGTPEGHGLFHDLNMLDDDNNQPGRGQISHDIVMLVLEDVQKSYIMDAARNRLAAGGTGEADDLYLELIRAGLDSIDFDKLTEDELMQFRDKYREFKDGEWTEWKTVPRREK